jgi:choline dehydrogenase-like flavoprotein
VARLATKSTTGPFHARPAGSSYEACLVDGAGQQEQGIGGCAFALDLLPAPEGPMESKLAALRTPTHDQHLSEHYPAPALRGAEPAGLWTRAFDVRPESAPDPESRVLLDAEVDANGQRKVRLRLRQGPFEGRTAARALELLASAVGRHGLGRLWIEPDVGRWRVEQGFHHAGTTRMHDDPAHGVVDRHGRVHSVDNLFVTGGSVFPTAGAVNPTFTIVALALRLADRLVESA